MPNRFFVPVPAILALVAAPTAGQATFVNPPGFATKEGPSHISLPFGSGQAAMHYQQICSTSTHPRSTGLIKHVAWRRDNDAGVASGDYTAWKVDLTVRLSTSPLPAARMSDVFKNNIGADVSLLFGGVIRWPAQQKSPPGPTPFVYRIPAKNAFLYTNTLGDLSIDIQRRRTFNNGNTLFMMDAVRESISPMPQQVSKIGTGCSNPTGNNDVLFYDNWIPGAHARVLLHNAANNSPVLWVVGFAPLAIPFDMGVAGAPGCSIYPLPLLQLSGATTDSTAPYQGVWDLRLDIPPSTPAALTFYSQFALLGDRHISNVARFSLSDSHRVSLGTFASGSPAHSQAHAPSLTATRAAQVQQGYAMITEFGY